MSARVPRRRSLEVLRRWRTVLLLLILLQHDRRRTKEALATRLCQNYLRWLLYWRNIGRCRCCGDCDGAILGDAINLNCDESLHILLLLLLPEQRLLLLERWRRMLLMLLILPTVGSPIWWWSVMRIHPSFFQKMRVRRYICL